MNLKPEIISQKSIRGSLGLMAIFVAYFTSFFVMSTMNNAMPRIAAELNGMQFYSWAIAIPALVSAFVILIFGKLSDMYGRRIILMASVGFMLLGAILSATSQTFILLIGALCVLSLGMGAIQPLCFSVLGDMFAPAERGKWAGLLNISSGITAFVGPTLGGWFVDNLSWHYIFWLDVPLILISGGIVLFGLPALSHRETHRIDFLGSVYLAVASTTLILGLSWAGSTYPWLSFQILGLLSISLLFWVLFLREESGAAEPMLDPKVLTNRTFLTASVAALLSIFGFTGMQVYYPLFLQGVQNTSATLSGKIITPFSVFASFMGIPAGFLLSRTRRYKWMYITGYAILVLVMWGAVSLNATTALGWEFAISALAGIGLGAIPTINALVVQYAVPKRSLGVATGGLYFFVMMGKAIAPAILGSVLNAVYARELMARLPVDLSASLNQTTLASISSPRALLSTSAMSELQKAFYSLGDQGPILFDQGIRAVRDSLETGLRWIFIFGAVTMLLSFLLILTIPEIKLDGQS
jgi:MFS family permease